MLEVLAIIALYSPLLFLVWFAFRPKKTDNNLSSDTTTSNLTKMFGFIFRVGFLVLLYLLLSVFSVFTTDSCGASGGCNWLMLGLGIGYIWLLVSFMFTFLSILDNRKTNVIFLPYIAAPIFIAIVAVAMKLQGM